MKSFFRLTKGFTLLGLAGLMIYGLGQSWMELAPLGELLSSSSGLWTHKSPQARDLHSALSSALKKESLADVTVAFDPNGVPRLFAKDQASLFFAQGFVTAYYRLWQMDFISRIALGRVSELVGSKALPIDRFFRRFQLPRAVAASSELMMADPITRVPIENYTRGVNARILDLKPEELPLEYKLFGIEPAGWTDDRAASLLKFMTWELTGYLYDLKLNQSRLNLPTEVFDLLFPRLVSAPKPILTNFSPAPVKEVKKRVGTRSGDYQGPPVVESSKELASIEREIQSADVMELWPDPSNGSNSWALGPEKTASGKPILSNDLHLGYSLPALWFPIQLVTPEFNVFGASLPGAPGVIAGFNSNTGWAVTNGTDDVLDWYELRFRDEKKQEYLFDDGWRPIVTHEEEIRTSSGERETIKLRETHFGPIVFESGDRPGVVDIPSGLVPQWTGFIASNELKSFLLLNRAKSAGECIKALSDYVAPSQNFICTDRHGSVNYLHAGLFPDRRGQDEVEHDSRLIKLASSASSLWKGYLSRSKSPTAVGIRSTIVTANQAPFAGPGLQEFGWFFAAPYRAMEIENALKTKVKWRGDDIAPVQAEIDSEHATWFRDWAISRLKEDDCLKSLSVERLKKWDGRFDTESREAAFITALWKAFEREMWTSLIGSEDLTYWPQMWRLRELIETETQSMLWDAKSTNNVETIDDRLKLALPLACKLLREASGEELPIWSKYQKTILQHTARIPGLGDGPLKVGGVAESVFANKGHHGPTWKMIVSFESPLKAWFMIPGGISGDPSSNQYDSWLEDWSRGRMKQFEMRDRP